MQIITILCPENEREAEMADVLLRAYSAMGVNVSSGHDGPYGSVRVSAQLNKYHDADIFGKSLSDICHKELTAK